MGVTRRASKPRREGRVAFKHGKARDLLGTGYAPGTNGWFEWLNGYDAEKEKSRKRFSKQEGQGT